MPPGLGSAARSGEETEGEVEPEDAPLGPVPPDAGDSVGEPLLLLSLELEAEEPDLSLEELDLSLEAPPAADEELFSLFDAPPEAEPLSLMPSADNVSLSR